MEQRREDRHAIDWAAEYRMTAASDWLPCRAVNLGRGGVAIEPLGQVARDELTGDVQIRFQLSGTDTFDLWGMIRHRTRTHRGGVLLGLEFAGLSTEEFETLDALRRTSTVHV